MERVGKKIIVPDSVMAREVGGEMVILNLDNEQYYGLDEVGARMWLHLTTSPNMQEALNILHNEYDAELEQLSKDLQELIGNLEAEGLLEVHDI